MSAHRPSPETQARVDAVMERYHAARRPSAHPTLARLCGKGTSNGAKAAASRYRFAPCIREYDHGGLCDSGPTDEPAPPARAA